MRKRILSVILLVCMLVNNLPVAAFAEGTDSGCNHVCDENCGYVAAVDCDKECPPAEEGAERTVSVLRKLGQIWYWSYYTRTI